MEAWAQPVGKGAGRVCRASRPTPRALRPHPRALPAPQASWLPATKTTTSKAAARSLRERRSTRRSWEMSPGRGVGWGVRGQQVGDGTGREAAARPPAQPARHALLQGGPSLGPRGGRGRAVRTRDEQHVGMGGTQLGGRR
jgi:hypothetical protein